MILRKLIFLLLPFFLFSCKGEDVQEGKDQAIHLDVFSNSAEELAFESIRAVPLETGEDILIGDRTAFVIHNNEFFIYEYEKHKSVLRFDSAGNFLNKVGKPGRGPEEYIPPADFTVHGDTVDFLDGGTKSNILGYHKNGEFLYSKTFDIYSMSFEKTETGYAFYTGYGVSSPSKYRLLLTDENGNITDQYLEDNKEWGVPLANINMYRSGSSICIPEFYNNSVYELRGETLESTFNLDYGEYAIPDAFYEVKNLRDGFKMIWKNNFATIVNYFENGNNAFFEIVVAQNKHEKKTHYLFYDRQQGQLYRKILQSKDPTSPFTHPVAITGNAQLVYLSSAYGFIKNREKLRRMVVNDEVLQNIDENDNPVVLFCEIKK